MPKIATLHTDVLKEMLRTAGLNTKGTKIEMAVRLSSHLETDEVDGEVVERAMPSATRMQAQINELRDMVNRLATMVEANINGQT